MNNCFLSFRIRISFPQPDEAFVGMNAHPQPLDRAGMDGDTAREMDSFDGCNFHIAASAFLQYLVLSKYGERADPGFDFLDADSSARVRARMGGDEIGR